MVNSIIRRIDRIVDVWAGLLKGQVFYIPTLGPVYTSGNSIKKLLHDVLNNSRTNEFLSYDKNKRWYKEKKEKILLSAVVINDNGLCISTKSNFKNNVLKIFYYTLNTLDNSVIKKVKKIAAGLKDIEEVGNCFLYCFKKPKIEAKFTCHNIYLKIITEKEYLAKLPKGIEYYDSLTYKVKQTFGRFKQESKLEGFGFLWKEFIVKDKPLSQIICAIEEGKIIGAIGPLDILKDPWDTLWLSPPYFGIKEKLRERGYGKKLWKAAMSLAYQRGAKYTLVQNIASSPAARFYEKQGLTKVGEVYSISLQ